MMYLFISVLPADGSITVMIRADCPGRPVMLFVTLCNVKPSSTTKERLARRVNWEMPEGVRVLGEYWPQTEHPAVVMIAEAESIVPLMKARAAWDDVFDIEIYPAVTAEEGLKLAEQMLEQEAVPA
jgi:hypothetical protein